MGIRFFALKQQSEKGIIATATQQTKKKRILCDKCSNFIESEKLVLKRTTKVRRASKIEIDRLKI